MHVCFVCREYPPSLRGGGIASYIKEVAHGLNALGHRVTVVCASDDTRKEKSYDEDGVNIIHLKGGDFIIPQVEKTSIVKKFRTFYRYLPYRKRIREALKTIRNIDIIEVAEYGAEAYYLQELGIPLVIRLHTPALMDHYNFGILPFNAHTAKFYWQGRHELATVKRAQYITSCSTSLKEWSVKELRIDRDKIKVIYNPLNTEKWTDIAFTRERNNEIKEILFAGTICDWKGCGDLAAACKSLADEGIKLRLNMVGKAGDFAEQLKNKYKTHPWFNLVGKVPREELIARYTTTDLVVFPSWWENMPMVCIEAMSQGAIVLGSSSGGMSEIIEDGKSGFLVEPRDSKILAEKIRQLLKLDTKQRVIISNNAKQRIKKAFSMDIVLERQIEYYKYVIKDFKSL